LNEIFKRKDKKSKDQAMYESYLQYGYTLKDIAEYIGVHYSTVSRAIKKIEGEDEK
jgi:DNA-binding MarR family transcriptional regulator